MIRFKADTWAEALLRFFSMAAPDGNVYVEIPAPDLRFAALVLLAICVLLFRRRLVGYPKPTLALLALIVVSAVPWLITTGNGRYYIPMLLCVGPAAVALAYLLPLSRTFRLFLAGGLLVAQTFVVAQSSPWGAWAWLPWGAAPYFQVDAPKPDSSVPPTTYVTLTSISYSLIAPQFPASSRWINVTSVGAAGRDDKWAKNFLDAAPGQLRLVVPSIQGQVESDGRPSRKVRDALDVLLAPQKLGLDREASCSLLLSQGLAAIGRKREAATAGSEAVGFWICPLRYPVEGPATKAQLASAPTEATFARIEQMCPRFFAPGAKTALIKGGALRHYPGSDMKVYVLDDGQVLYKFWRALNPVTVGTVKGILGGVERIQCDHIRGRSGLPWEREI